MKYLDCTFLLTVASICLICPSVWAQTAFTNAIDTDWSNLSNWSNGLPSDTNEGTIETGALCYMPDGTYSFDYVLNIDGTLVTPDDGSVELLEGADVEVDQEGVLSIQSAFTITGGEISNRGYVIDEYGLTLDELGTINNFNHWEQLDGFASYNGTLINFGLWYTCASYGTGGDNINGNGFISGLCPSQEICDGIDTDLDGVVDDNTCGTTFTAAVSEDITDEDNWDNALPNPRNPGLIPSGLTADCTVPEFFSTYYDLKVQGSLVLGQTNSFFGNLYNEGSIFPEESLADVTVSLLACSFFNEGDFTGDIALDVGVLNRLENGGTIDLSSISALGSAEVHNTGTVSFSEAYNFGLFCYFYNEGTVNAGSSTVNNGGEIYNCSGTWNGAAPTDTPINTSDCPSYEICDSVDNDGDGEVDEGCGCRDTSACNYDEEAIVDDTCTFTGCTLVAACNYDPTAGCGDQDLCEFESCAGCTYTSATNYDPAATLDDGSCIEPTDTSCISDVDADGETGVGDLLVVLGAYGTTCD